jgi:RHS repeat-associated protein
MKVDASSVKLYYHANRQYSVTAMTDANKAVVERYAYSPYGVTTILAPNGSTPRATSAVGNPYMYTGRRLDKEFATTSEDAIYYYRARYYLPPLGRFGSRDLLRYVDGMSVYAGYFAMQHGLDPSGLDDDDEHWKERLEAAGVDVQEAIDEAKNMGMTDPEQIKDYVEKYNVSGGRGGRFKCGRYRGKSLAQLIGGGIKKAWNRLFGSGGGTKGVTRPAGPGTPKPLGRGSTGRTVPHTLGEHLAMKQAMSDPAAGDEIDRITMNDPRWPASDGWVKMSQNINGIEIHYVRNTITGAVDDFKFK